ncbi:hypothetical protein LTR37_000578 [Vermiconidia calcicola]|uniref:Uncharacterized protein n=1 Tax=Vermiconidia calcicola TaxID=1690605 RepID=A0ACC3NY26_9PEZI|nr:hypothetical protein LTR37_000578 [Vermiconidia calcicola]
MAPLSRVPTTDYSNDPYSWEGATGWKAWRCLRPGRGMYYDIKRRAPYYWSDIIDGFNYRTFAGTIRIFFVNLLPALAFQLDMERNTDGYFGINEGLFASALAAVVFSTLSCQPLTVVGITGLISLFNYTIYDIAKAQGIGDLYPQFIAWCSIWAAITHWAAAVFNWCDYMRYITDFSSQSFGMYVGIIYMIKGVQELIAQFDDGIGGEAGSRQGGYLACIIALVYWFSVYSLENIGGTIYSRNWLRKSLSDFAYPIATIWWTGFSHLPGRLADTPQLRIPHTRAFYPTTDRSWLVDFWNLPVKWVFVALPIGILLTLLFYYDHNVSSLTAQAKQFPLKKPAGFHWDFFLLGCTCFIGGIVGVPLPNGLVPQAPVHTDSCTVYQDVRKVTHEKDDEPDAEWEQHNTKIVEAVSVKEQRISHWLMALGFIGLMTGPLLDVLHTIPRSLFCGVFFVVGWGSIGGNGITANLFYIFKEKQFIDPAEPRLKMKNSRIAYYIMFQFAGVFTSVAISQTIAAIGFPVIIISLIPLRWLILPRIFTEEELLILDAPTANADVVLASMGGQPTLPEVAMAEQKRRQQYGDGENGQSSSGYSNGTDTTRSREGYKDEEEEEIGAEKERRKKEQNAQPPKMTGQERD